ncbi:hypothetical protein MKZ38_004077 [Zalerion maritima]|uniref:Phosphoribosyltransferase domain-containing protein n=1 Tax=Zalerion maritima TaxID=339359 RepID=A0AAD5WUH9_9PEZI|nr:hypothetical protein MKZ38_004077 [Zalerion maritima]
MSDSLASGRTQNPTVIGIYGVPGSGKSYLVRELENTLGTKHFQFFEGSGVLNTLVPGGLDAFKALADSQKMIWRETAIAKIQEECSSSGRIGVVSGHITFWDNNQSPSPTSVHTMKDLEIYTHILYLDIPASVVHEHRSHDNTRSRTPMSVEHLEKWMREEVNLLRDLCLRNMILFCAIRDPKNTVSGVIEDIRENTQDINVRRIETKLNDSLHACLRKPETMLVLDADRTLGPHDTGTLFWEAASASTSPSPRPLKRLFSSPMGYSYTAFRQAAFMYDEVDPEQYGKICDKLSTDCSLYPEIRSLLLYISNHDHIGAVVITCGLARVWENILSREGFRNVKVIGCGLVSDGIVVTPETKAMVVRRLQEQGIHTFAFGDSPLDLPMLKEAGSAIIIVGDDNIRSKTMAEELLCAIAAGEVSGARQVLLPGDVSPIMDTTKLPSVTLDSPEFLQGVTAHRSCQSPTEPKESDISLLHASSMSSTKLLMTPMRDSRVSGSALRGAHHRVGWYLATRFLPDVMGTEAFSIPHVQGHQTDGYRIKNEVRTVIIALMRGGEPMAFGVSEAIPQAMFLHAKGPGDVRAEHLQGMETVVLVDSVVNTGKSIIAFVGRVKELGTKQDMKIVVIAGTVQEKAVGEGGPLARLGGITIVSLRLSENKFTGRGGTDTGNRLFNTTHME